MRPPFSRFMGGLRIGADFFERREAVVMGKGPPRGVVDRMTDLSNPALDTSRVHPAVVAFFEDTAGLELLVRSRWRFPFSLGWRFFRVIMRWVGQFVLPVTEGRILTRALALDTEKDGRPGARAIVRTYIDTGEVMQAVAYATWEREGTRYMSATFPLPGGHVAGILRVDAIAEDDRGRLAVALTSRPRSGDDAAVWLVAFGWAVRSPFGEKLELWSTEMRGVPGVPLDHDGTAMPDASLLGRHEQRIFGVRFVTHDYWFRPTGGVGYVA